MLKCYGDEAFRTGAEFTEKDVSIMKKLLALLLCIAMICSLGAVFADDSDLAYIQGKGTLVVGITDFEPMDYKDGDEWIGFDADMSKAFAASLGVAVQFVEIDWDNRIVELDSKAIDCIWNGMTLTPEMVSASSTSKAYANNAQIIIVKADKADAFQAAESLQGLTVAVEAGSAGKLVLDDLGIDLTINEVQSQAAALMEVAAGTSDAAVIDRQMAVAMTGEGTSYPDLVYTVGLNEEEYGVAFRTGSELAEMLNSFFAASWADGSMKELADKYGVTAMIIPQE